MQTFKAIGRRGDWFATINGEEIPCAWSWWQRGNPAGGFLYCDPEARPGTGKWIKYVEAIQRSGKVTLTGKKKVALTGKKEDSDGKWQRKGYIGLYAVTNLKTSENSLEFDMPEKIADLV
jgi:hypothetical protein